MDHIASEDPYGDFPKVCSKIRERRMRVAGHCVRQKEEEALRLVLWQPQHGQTKRGRPNTTYVHTLIKDTVLDTIGELRTARGRIQLLSELALGPN